MVLFNSYTIAVIFCVITMLCWGSWANTQKFSGSKWPFQLYYWDYTVGIVILTMVLAITVGSSGTNNRHFLPDLFQAESRFLISAFVGGVIFNFANILLVIAIDIAGMSIAFPLGIGVALIIGVISSYIEKPTGNPFYLFIGIGLVALAIIVDTIAYKNILNSNKKTPIKGIVISLLAGISMGLFYRYVSQSMSMSIISPEVGKLTPFTALVVFSFGLFVSNFIFNTINMYKPVTGKPVGYKMYFKTGTAKLHLLGLWGGIIWGIGMSFSILASNQAGIAITYGVGQGATTVVATLWGVFIWDEFKDLPSSKNWLIVLMFCLFSLGLGLIIFSKSPF